MEKRIEKIGMKLDTVSVKTKGELSLGNLQENIGEVCHMLSRELGLMNMNRKMQLCRDLIEKVVAEKQNVEIHYKFPVSSNFNKKGERPKILQSAFGV